jgi:hypothetical protein
MVDINFSLQMWWEGGFASFDKKPQFAVSSEHLNLFATSIMKQANQYIGGGWEERWGPKYLYHLRIN